MPNPQENKQAIDNLTSEIEELKRVLESHQHLGQDGSKELNEQTELKGKKLYLSGAGKVAETFFSDQIELSMATRDALNESRASFIGSIISQQDTPGSLENLFTVMGSGKNEDLDEEIIKPSNKIDWNKVRITQTVLLHRPDIGNFTSGPSNFPKSHFFYAYSSPVINGSGVISNGGTTLEDINADFTSLTYCTLTILSDAGAVLGAAIISSNTSTIITVDRDWAIEDGTYDYIVSAPIFLGQQDVPWSRIYIRDDMRLGIGASNGKDVIYVKWGFGSPEGVVVGNPGSLYLNQSGGANTTLYIKESGTSTTGWIAK